MTSGKHNLSYECVVHEENGSQEHRVSSDDLITDLKNKLASSHSLNNQLTEEIELLRGELKSRETQLLILDGQLNKYIKAKQVILKEVCTQTLDRKLVCSDVGCHVDMSTEVSENDQIDSD